MVLHIFIHIAHAAAEAAAEASASESGGAIGALGLNLKLFIAQLINFAVVLLVLWKWAFKPVTRKLQERTDRIEKAMRDAQSTSKEKEDFGKWKDLEMTRVRSQTAAIMAAAEAQAGKSRREILDQTKQEQAKLVDETRKQIEQEKQKIVQDAKAELADLVTFASEKILREKLDNAKDRELIQETLKSI
jgi:F-type H+-transporting ATPase subunit b